MPVLQKLKETYIFWYQNYLILPKPHKYSLGGKIDKLFVEMQLIVDSFDYSRRHMNEFMSKQVVLSMLVCEAEQKMGYVSVFNENK